MQSEMFRAYFFRGENDDSNSFKLSQISLCQSNIKHKAYLSEQHHVAKKITTQ